MTSEAAAVTERGAVATGSKDSSYVFRLILLRPSRRRVYDPLATAQGSVSARCRLGRAGRGSSLTRVMLQLGLTQSVPRSARSLIGSRDSYFDSWVPFAIERRDERSCNSR